MEKKLTFTEAHDMKVSLVILTALCGVLQIFLIMYGETSLKFSNVINELSLGYIVAGAILLINVYLTSRKIGKDDKFVRKEILVSLILSGVMILIGGAGLYFG